MQYPKVSILLSNGNLGGVIATLDGIAGIVLTGASEGTLTVGTPFSINELKDFEAYGITSATTLNVDAYRQLKEYYQELGGQKLLYVMLVPDTMTAAIAADYSQASGAKKLIDYAQGDIKFIGIALQPAGTVTITAGINATVYTAETNLQAMLETYKSKQMPMRGVIAATSFSGTASALTNVRTSTHPRVALLIGDTVNTNTTCCVGLLLGRIGKNPVQRKISRVKDGAISSATAFIGATAVNAYSTPENIHDKGFITLRTFPRKTGFFFTSDPTCAADTDDYSSLCRGAVIDKVESIIYGVYINEVDDEVPVEADGTISPGYAQNLETIIERQVNEIMTANREISGFKCTVDLKQNVVATNKVKLKHFVLANNYASLIENELGFAAKLS